MTAKPILSISSCSFSYDQHQILSNISFTIQKGDFVALIGPNGSGKTTLAKLLLGLLTPTEGTIKRSVSARKIAYVPQRYSIDRNFPGTVREILSPCNEKVLKQTGIKDLLDSKFTKLSGGQQQKVLITFALQQNPSLLILDEPTTGVDLQAQEEFYALLKKLNRKGITIIFVTHEVGVLPTLVKKILCINKSVCCIGKPRELPQLLEKIYGKGVAHHQHKHSGHQHKRGHAHV